MASTPKFIVLTEAYNGEKLFELTDEIYTLGRTDDNSVYIPDNSVSSKHCELHRNADGSYSAVDLGSSNGTRINGVRVENQKLVHSDILQVGGIEIMFHCDDEAVTSGQNSQTGINLEDTAGGLQIQELENVNPFKKGAKKSDGKKANLVLYSVISGLGLIVLILTFILLRKLM